MKVVFFGTPQFAADVLEFLLDNQVEIVAVISKPDRPKGRSGHPVFTPVKEILLSHQPSIPLFQPEIVSDSSFAETLQSFNADLFVVVAYGEIIKQQLLDMPRSGCINLHASLLPKYRGAAPIQRCIINGEVESGVTIMHMVKKMDAGDMIKVVTAPITEEMTFGELEQELCEIGKSALLEVIRLLTNGLVSSIPQDPSKVVFAPKIELEDCEIDWQNSAKSIHNLVRGVNPHPGAWCKVLIRGESKRLKILKTSVLSASIDPDSLLKKWVVSTGEGDLEILEVKLEGKKTMSSNELLRGIPKEQIIFTK